MAFAIMVAFCLAFGWFALWQQRIVLGGGKHATGPAILEGSGTTLVAFASFAVAAALLTVLLRLLGAARAASASAIAAVFGLPVLFLLVRG